MLFKLGDMMSVGPVNFAEQPLSQSAFFPALFTEFEETRPEDISGFEALPLFASSIPFFFTSYETNVPHATWGTAGFSWMAMVGWR